MKLSEFIALNEDQKRSTVLKKGVVLAKRLIEDQVVFLFQLQEYYVEIYCCNKSKDVMQYIAFQNTRQLAPYLDEIPISHLINKSK